jgi:uncharacterized protein (TIGR02246 family)
VKTALLSALSLIMPLSATAAPRGDVETVAALDTAYQAAVKANDAAAMAKIMHPDFVLILGSGDVVSRDVLLGLARNRTYRYDHQEEEAGAQRVRVFGDTAVVTSKIWIRGATADGKGVIDSHQWFSDTYVRTPQGWRYAVGQATAGGPPR